MAHILESQADVPYTPGERAQVERLNAHEELVIAAYVEGDGGFILVRVWTEIAKRRVKISRAARRRACATINRED